MDARSLGIPQEETGNSSLKKIVSGLPDLAAGNIGAVLVSLQEDYYLWIVLP